MRRPTGLTLVCRELAGAWLHSHSLGGLLDKLRDPAIAGDVARWQSAGASESVIKRRLIALIRIQLAGKRGPDARP